jgi:hypothetical protein
MPNLADSKYPSASEIPELNIPGGDASKPNGGGEPAQNPVLGYLQGLQAFVATLEKQNSPQAAKIKQSFMTLLQDISSLAGGGGQPGQSPAPGSPGQPPPGGPPAPEQAPPQGGGMNKTMPMNSSATAKPLI